jgi:hypothetical protein
MRKPLRHAVVQITRAGLVIEQYAGPTPRAI